MLFVAALTLLCAPAVSIVLTPCASGECRLVNAPGCVYGTEPSCACVASVYGVACVECNYAGYIQNGQCVCYDGTMDPLNPLGPCLPPIYTRWVQNLIINTTTSYAWCECSSSFQYGMYKLSQGWVGPYGSINPPVCVDCGDVYIGPATTTIEGSPLAEIQACTQYGGVNPNSNFNSSQWVACAGTGTWNFETFRCDVDPSWTLVSTGHSGYMNETIHLGLQCAPFWGPVVDLDVPLGYSATSPGFCTAIYTPDYVDGVFRECGGHGSFISGACVCDNSTTLTNITDTFTVLEYASAMYNQVEKITKAFTVESCDAV